MGDGDGEAWRMRAQLGTGRMEESKRNLAHLTVDIGANSTWVHPACKPCYLNSLEMKMIIASGVEVCVVWWFLSFSQPKKQHKIQLLSKLTIKSEYWSSLEFIRCETLWLHLREGALVIWWWKAGMLGRITGVDTQKLSGFQQPYREQSCVWYCWCTLHVRSWLL